MLVQITNKGIEEITKHLNWKLREDIPATDYLNGLYGQSIIFDLEADDHHEIPSRYTKTGHPDAFSRDIFISDSFEKVTD